MSCWIVIFEICSIDFDRAGKLIYKCLWEGYVPCSDIFHKTSAWWEFWWYVNLQKIIESKMFTGLWIISEVIRVTFGAFFMNACSAIVGRTPQIGCK